MKRFTIEEKNEVLETPFIHIHRKLDVLLNIAKLLMECGADTVRIVSEIQQAATFMGIPHNYLNIHISYTTIMVNIFHEERSITVFRKTPTHIPNMAMINAISKLTWRAFERHYSLTTYERLVGKLQQTIPVYPVWAKGIACALGSAGLAYLYSADIIALVVTFICSLCGYFMRVVSQRLGFNEYLGNAICAFTAMFIAYGFYTFIELGSLVYVLVCCTLFMIPGVPLINSVIDTINNHILSGITRAIRTLLIVGSMTLGMAMAHLLPHANPVHKVTIIPRGYAGGYTMMLPKEEHDYKTKAQLLADIRVALGGRIAEALVLGDISTGASGDLQSVTNTARSMVTRWGMSDTLGPIVFGEQQEQVFLGKNIGHERNYSEEVASKIDVEIHHIVDEAYRDVEQLLTDNMDFLHNMAKALLEEETIDAKAVENLHKYGTTKAPDETEAPTASHMDAVISMPNATEETKTSSTESDVQS